MRFTLGAEHRPHALGAASLTYSARVLAYAVVSANTEKAVELSVRREDAERFLDELQADDQELAELLSARAGRAQRLTTHHLT